LIFTRFCLFQAPQRRARISPIHGFPQGKTMRSKWFRRIKRFIELFTPGGTEYTSKGIAIHYSSDGVTTIPPSEYKKIIFPQLEEFKKAALRSGAGTEQKDPN
jgi:hypothetical protein